MLETLFSEKELRDMLNFENEHLKMNCGKRNKTNTTFTIEQKWTSIGVNTIISCDCCGRFKDVTDYSVW